MTEEIKSNASDSHVKKTAAGKGAKGIPGRMCIVRRLKRVCQGAHDARGLTFWRKEDSA